MKPFSRLGLPALFAWAITSQTAGLDPLARHGDLGIVLKPPSGSPPGSPIAGIRAGSSAETGGLKVGDRVLKIGSMPLDQPLAPDRALAAVRAGRAVVLEVNRASEVFHVSLIPSAVPMEKIPGVDVSLGSVITSQGYRLRTIVTRPKNATGRLPGLLLAGWLSCDSVESAAAADGFSKILHGIAERAGFVFLRVDKPGVGDSEGPPCDQTDFETELGGYRAGLTALRARPDVDPNRLFILGMSNGGGIAPLVAETVPVAGYIVSGGWAKTWLEHMMELERHRLALSGKSAGEVSEALKPESIFYGLYLKERLTPAQVIIRKPELARFWDDLPEHQYGRPAVFYHQLQSLDLPAAWEKVRVPVLSIHGEHDWLMSREDHEWIAATVNRNRPGAGRFVEVPKMDHFYLLHGSAEQAFRNDPKGSFASKALDSMVDWLVEQAALRSRAGAPP